MANATPKKEATVNAHVNECVYSAEELAANHKAFRTSYEIVVIALRQAGKDAATFTEAKSIIEKFKTKEVK